MRNRAKCKLCKSIIEPVSDYDYVACKCGEIAVEGCNSLKVFANDLTNVIRIDDMGNEIIPKVVEKAVHNVLSEETLSIPHRLNKEEMLLELDRMIQSIEQLPPEAMSTPINHYDWLSSLMLLSSILRTD